MDSQVAPAAPKTQAPVIDANSQQSMLAKLLGSTQNGMQPKMGEFEQTERARLDAQLSHVRQGQAAAAAEQRALHAEGAAVWLAVEVVHHEALAWK